MGYLSKAHCKGFASYKYVSGEYTILDHVQTPFWNFCARQLPRNIHPNLITLAGGVWLVAAHLVWGLYSPDFNSEVPSWVYYLGAFSVFASQTFDAIDGKQARRTGVSSPIGQLFDHGQDAVTCHMLQLGCAAALRCGPTWQTFAMMYMGQVPFYMSTLGEYHTGVMNTNFNQYVGVTEAQWVLTFLQLAPAWLGTGALERSAAGALQEWAAAAGPGAARAAAAAAARLPAGLSVRGAILAAAVAYTGVVVVQTLLRCAREPHVGDTGAKQLGARALASHMLILAAQCGIVAAWILMPGPPQPGQVRLTCQVLGILFGWQTANLIINHMAKQPATVVWQAYVPVLLMTGNAYVGWMDPLQATRLALLWILSGYLTYALSIVREISKYLGISVFTMPSKTKGT